MGSLEHSADSIAQTLQEIVRLASDIEERIKDLLDKERAAPRNL